MIGSLFFIFNRLVEITFLIPIIGIMAYFVHGYLQANMLTPPYILVLFIVSVIAVFWAVDTLIRFSTTKRSAFFVSFVDMLFFGAFIAGVYQLRFIANADCGHWDGGSVWVSLGPFGEYGQSTNNPLADHVNKTCAMLKTTFAMGIMEVIFFIWTAFLALFIHSKNREVIVKETTVRRRSHSSRRGHSSSHHRHRSSSRRPHYVV
ncbi:hypothetical protein N7462_010222 [Penicillium macrosclerotiorum]|uniref:uncharacterized protein n=1 Tax=Penicillium macrosclerotiorum TaxID=303699 RepID=UPI0025485A85|nr:uncharacterized protein N7462_010222 [Penicillium macrosclerotiorum]KAJ5669152.1 hypothetical protein N7462_010222 [Penicillium macrosclerotiorum]